MEETYIVGGAVRDVLLNKDPKDIDFCVVGSTPDKMIKKGFKPINTSSFPVFHDDEGQEYALARTERKVGAGYHGFECDFDDTITLEEDLYRRDLSMNSMAVHIKDWEAFKLTKDEDLLIDPYNGLKSLNDKKIKHTSKHFVEDPVRAVRAVRLANRYRFTICKSTKKMIIELANSGELSHLTSERIWLEIGKIFKQSNNIGGFFAMCEELRISENIFPKFDSDELFINYNGLKAYNDSSIKSDEFAFISMMNTNNLSYVEKFCKYLKISSRFLNIFKAYVTIENYFYSEPGDPGSIIQCLIDLNSYKDFETTSKIINFFLFIEKRYEKECYLLEKCFNMTNDIRFDSLTEEQQKILKGSQIGEAINKLKIKTITEFIGEE